MRQIQTTHDDVVARISLSLEEAADLADILGGLKTGSLRSCFYSHSVPMSASLVTISKEIRKALEEIKHETVTAQPK